MGVLYGFWRWEPMDLERERREKRRNEVRDPGSDIPPPPGPWGSDQAFAKEVPV